MNEQAWGRPAATAGRLHVQICCMVARDSDAQRWVHGGKGNDFQVPATLMNLLQPLAPSTRAAELNT